MWNYHEQLLRLDRGRSVFCRPQLSQDDWRMLLARHGLKLSNVRPIVGPGIIRFWDVGLRPFSIALLKQRQAWKDAGALPLVKPGAVDFSPDPSTRCARPLHWRTLHEFAGGEQGMTSASVDSENLIVMYH